MRKLILATAAAGLVAAGATSANAAVTVVTAIADDLYGTTLASYGMTMLDDFDAINDSRTSYSGNIIEYPAEFQDPIVNSAPPPYSGGIPIGGAPDPVDPTSYASVQGGTSGTYSMLNGNYLRGFSFYMGSPDTYNKVTFNFLGGGSQSLMGEDIWGGTPPGDGDRGAGYRVYYDFGSDKVSSIVFESSQDAFEFDGLAGVVPEPATWAMMIMGFGAAGGLLRSKRRRLAAMTA